MKLATKLLLAPMLAVGVVLVAAGINTVLMTRQADHAQREFKGHIDIFKALAAIDPALAYLKFLAATSTSVHASNRHEIAEPRSAA